MISCGHRLPKPRLSWDVFTHIQVRRWLSHTSQASDEALDVGLSEPAQLAKAEAQRDATRALTSLTCICTGARRYRGDYDDGALGEWALNTPSPAPWRGPPASGIEGRPLDLTGERGQA